MMHWSNVLLILAVWTAVAAVVALLLGRLIQMNDDDGEDVACRAGMSGQATA
jgi:hypothetical protein